MNDNVNHPAHYNIPGRKECIEEMVDVFGVEKTMNFCELNSYKYEYRHELKNGQEDLDKSQWYKDKYEELSFQNPMEQIAAFYGIDIQEQQLVEEMGELIQAICKHKRSRGWGQSIRGKWSPDSLVEEIADVKLVLDQVIFLLGCEKEVQEVVDYKIKRTLERMDKDCVRENK